MDVRIGGVGRSRPIRPEDVVTRQEKELMVVECRPADGAVIDLEIDLPYGVQVEARTVSGFLSLEGLIARAHLSTDTGNIELRVPWEATELELTAEQAPHEFRGPAMPAIVPRGGSQKWRVVHRIPVTKIRYGKIQVSAREPGEVLLADQPIPEDSWVKLPRQAVGVLADILRSPEKQQEIEPLMDGPAKSAEQGVFRSEVRMVNLMVSVVDRKGRPLLELQAEDFEVLENGMPQKLSSVVSEEAPFNVAILLDWSGSTRKDRVAMHIAAQRFIDAARPQDAVAVYAVLADLFTVISSLGHDHERVKSLVRRVPASTGASPIYDAIVLAYNQELRRLPDERNALIILSDGVDNQIRQEGLARGSTGIGGHQGGLPSKVRFEDLSRASRHMNALLYPVFLPPKRTQTSFAASPAGLRSRGGVRAPSIQTTGTGTGQWQHVARDRLKVLAGLSGGRMFQAESVRDLKPIFPLITEELRSVYTIAYYPSNQQFDGAWRDVAVKVKGRNAVVRTRDGYVAR
jgi:Ca-activated chloride channel family protein